MSVSQRRAQRDFGPSEASQIHLSCQTSQRPKKINKKLTFAHKTTKTIVGMGGKQTVNQSKTHVAPDGSYSSPIFHWPLPYKPDFGLAAELRKEGLSFPLTASHSLGITFTRAEHPGDALTVYVGH